MQPGDVVKLRSGGPEMTVSAVSGENVEVIYYEEKHGQFYKAPLELSILEVVRSAKNPKPVKSLTDFVKGTQMVKDRVYKCVEAPEGMNSWLGTVVKCNGVQGCAEYVAGHKYASHYKLGHQFQFVDHFKFERLY